MVKMEIIKTGCNAGAVITDERVECSYGIPVVVVKGISYGNDDVIEFLDGSNFTGEELKRQFCESDFKNNEEIYKWCANGTSIKSWEDHRAESDALDNALKKRGFFNG